METRMTAIIVGLIGQVLPWLLAAGGALLGLRWLTGKARQEGVQQQHTADLEQNAKDQRTSDAVHQDVARLPDAAVDQRMRKWERD
jgi:hypothetical protein